MVEADDAHKAGIGSYSDGRVARELRHVVVRYVLDVVDFAGFERLHRGHGLRDVEPFDAVDLRHLGASRIVWRLGARDVVRILDVDGLVARLPFLPEEFERSRTVDFGYLREGVGLGEPLGQNKRGRRGRRAERFEHREAALQHDPELAVVNRFDR